MMLGYAFTVLNYIFYCSSRFCRNKLQMLAWDLMSKVSFVIGLLFLGSLSGAYSMLVTFSYLICANIKERRKQNWPVLYIVFQALLVYVMLSSFAGASSVFIFLSTSIALFSVWWLSPQNMRAAGLIANAMTLCYNISLRNWAGMFELAVMASNIASYRKYRKTLHP